MRKTWIIGGGMTGLAVGIASGFPLLEAEEQPGGICASYGICPKTGSRKYDTGDSEDHYRFEIGGGHWIFGGDKKTLHFLESHAPMYSYARHSGVFFAKRGLYVPYPIQHHLRYLGSALASQVLGEIEAAFPVTSETIHDWAFGQFGPTLGGLFFGPFHERYTAGLWKSVKPENGYKSPLNLRLVRQGMVAQPLAAGYNLKFRYPKDGLHFLAQKMAERTQVCYSKRVTSINTTDHRIQCVDGTTYEYDRIVATLSLCHLVRMTGLCFGQLPDPYSSVLVVNIGAQRGPRCPDEHWLYVPDSKSGFFRVGFYSNVSTSFLPKSCREGSHVSLYVERSLLPENKPNAEELAGYTQSVIEELQDWDFIRGVEITDANWIEVAYTWRRPGSRWCEEARSALEARGIFPVGRYARWHFQGIADSVRDGLILGNRLAGNH